MLKQTYYETFTNQYATGMAMLVQGTLKGIGFGGLLWRRPFPKIPFRYSRFVEPAGSGYSWYRNRGFWVSGSITYGNLTGDDARSVYPSRKLSFQTSLLEACSRR